VYQCSKKITGIQKGWLGAILFVLTKLLIYEKNSASYMTKIRQGSVKGCQTRLRKVKEWLCSLLRIAEPGDRSVQQGRVGPVDRHSGTIPVFPAFPNKVRESDIFMI